MGGYESVYTNKYTDLIAISIKTKTTSTGHEAINRKTKTTSTGHKLKNKNNTHGLYEYIIKCGDRVLGHFIDGIIAPPRKHSERLVACVEEYNCAFKYESHYSIRNKN
ncbi:hypothetical protein MdSGHV061 [Musca domestica salivary gland hypertrophy virus]|uniref:Uncharacterized protein n=1 Tax=Musca hytrovirus(isolate Musca domestica/United States/Boucias/-) TaxID=523909 RepID=B2YG38_MHVB|nr:hypothetical protein MdSGHV061 [Musca domestica salivary gland hypertrophy virus]ACD03520.1 hypothetical protein MdSGHV061 [Musca domestica salivary gland hypertrophy virus]